MATIIDITRYKICIDNHSFESNSTKNLKFNFVESNAAIIYLELTDVSLTEHGMFRFHCTVKRNNLRYIIYVYEFTNERESWQTDHQSTVETTGPMDWNFSHRFLENTVSEILKFEKGIPRVISGLLKKGFPKLLPCVG